MKLDASRSNRLYLLLTLLAGLFILLPSLNYQPFFSVGDHGRDLYAFSMSAKGLSPYQDYLWVYGPLMPYYYAFFLNTVGDSIATVVFAETLLKFLSGLTLYFILRWLTTPFWSFLASVFFWCFFPYFFYTYNHTGGILLILLSVLSLIRYIFTLKKTNLCWGLASIVLLSFVKINFGIFILAAYTVSVFIVDKTKSVHNKAFYWLALGALPLLIFSVYFLLTYGLPKYVIQQCFPYTKGGRQHSLAFSGIIPQTWRFITYYITNSWRDLTFAFISVFAVVSFIFSYKKIDSSTRENIRLTAIALMLLLIACLHEFIPSGVYYRFIWALPLQTIIIFICLVNALKHLPKIFTVLIAALLALITFNKLEMTLRNIQKHQDKKYYLALDRGGILIENSPLWLDTVQRTVLILERELKRNELFFALPYDPLYYYLLNRESPTYQIVFFDYMNIPKLQDQQTINDLKQKNVNWIVMSNRIRYVEPSTGEFGKSNSPLLAEYINENFEITWELGSWDKEPGWSTNHGIRILKRRAK